MHQVIDAGKVPLGGGRDLRQLELDRASKQADFLHRSKFSLPADYCILSMCFTLA